MSIKTGLRYASVVESTQSRAKANLENHRSHLHRWNSWKGELKTNSSSGAPLDFFIVAAMSCKFYYFQIVQNTVTGAMDQHHQEAVAHLKKTDQRAKKFYEEHQRRVEPLNEEQREQLARFLSRRRKERPDLHPPPRS